MHDDTLQQLERLIEVRRWGDARRLLQRLFAEDPDDAEAHCYAARIAIVQGDEAAAAEHVGLAIAADPQHWEARLIRFDLLLEGKRWGEAEQAILELLREEPADPGLLALYGRLMIFTAHFEKARALVGEALRREPAHRPARAVALLLAIVEGDRGAAEGRLAELLADDPASAGTAYALFAVLVDGRRYREALRVGQELLRHRPDSPELVEALVELRAATHPLSWPAWPAVRFGWAGSAASWGLAIAVLAVLGRVAPAWVGVFAIGYLGWCVYTWTYGPLLKRWIARRGV